jgi:hypothetical protein
MGTLTIEVVSGAVLTLSTISILIFPELPLSEIFLNLRQYFIGTFGINSPS